MEEEGEKKTSHAKVKRRNQGLGVRATKGACSRRCGSPSQSGKPEDNEYRSIRVRRTLPGLSCKNGGIADGRTSDCWEAKEEKRSVKESKFKTGRPV